MRPVTAGEIAALGAAQRWNAVTVEVQNGSGTFIDYTDWHEALSFGRSIDQPITSATVRFRRDKTPAADYSLAPLMESSDLNVDDAMAYSPALDAGRQMRIRIATTAFGVAPIAGDFHDVFVGEIDRVGSAHSPVEVVARDLGAILKSRFIEARTTYGSAGGTAMETVIQDILNDWTAGPVTLYSPNGTLATPFAPADSPGFLITESDFGDISVFDALERLALKIGWVIRYRWLEAVGAYVLMLYEPDRTKSVADWTFGPNRYIGVRVLDIDREAVRNVIAISYPDATAGRTTLMTADNASILRYGRQFLQITEPAGSPVDTAPEAQAMIDAALSDLKDPMAEQQIETLLFWPVELEDFYAFSPNGTHYDVEQKWAVVSYRHEIDAGRERTILDVRGAVAGQYNGWIRRGMPVVNRPAVGFQVIEFPVFSEAVGGGGGGSEGLPTVLNMAVQDDDVNAWLTFDVGPYTESVQIQYSIDYAPWANTSDSPMNTTPNGTGYTTVSVTTPGTGSIAAFRVKPFTGDGLTGTEGEWAMTSIVV